MTRANLQATSTSHGVLIPWYFFFGPFMIDQSQVIQITQLLIKTLLLAKTFPSVDPANSEPPITKSSTSATDSGSARASSCDNQSPRHSWRGDWIKNDLQEYLFIPYRGLNIWFVFWSKSRLELMATCTRKRKMARLAVTVTPMLSFTACTWPNRQDEVRGQLLSVL